MVQVSSRCIYKFGERNRYLCVLGRASNNKENIPPPEWILRSLPGAYTAASKNYTIYDVPHLYA